MGGCGGVVVVMVVAAALSSTSNALFVDKHSPMRKVMLPLLRPMEHHHFFGDTHDPVFHLVRPRLLPCAAIPQNVRLTIRSEDFHVDAELVPSEGLLAPHLSDGVVVDGEVVPLQPALCHFRTSNATHVVSVNNCDGHGLDGILVTPDTVGNFHPLPARLLPRISPHLPTAYLNPANGKCIYGLHILHLTKKTPTTSRRKRREAERDADDEPITCATGPQHDVRRVREAHDPRPRRFHDLNELTRGLDPHMTLEGRQAGLPESLGNNGHLMNHNHTVTASPVSAVLRRTVELAVFCDNVLYQEFPLRVDSDSKSQLVNFVLTIINAVQGIYHQDELQGYVVDLKVVKLDVFTTTSSDQPSPSGGDIGAYLNSFCEWQQRVNPATDSDPSHWDHALMLSGLDLHSSGNPSVIGLAWVGGMCRPSLSCTMNEGRSFMSVYVVAHEMGHNFGMNHDGQGDAQSCSNSKYIMSPSVGPGKTEWSTCSTQVIHSFLRKSSCLEDGGAAASFISTSRNEAGGRQKAGDVREQRQAGVFVEATRKTHEVKLESLLKKTPGYHFPLDKQCKAMHGRDFQPALTNKDLCDYLYCTNGVVTRPAQPALEGSFCGFHRICIAGRCRPEEELANLLLYNIASPNLLPPSGSGVPSSSPQPTTTSTHVPTPPPLPPPSSEFTTQPSTTTSSTVLPTPTEPCMPVAECSDNSSTSPTADPMTNMNCTCDSPTTSSETLANVPKEICPFLAPVFHHIFNCSAECPVFDLHLDLISGNLTQMVIEPTLFDEASQSCIFNHYSVIGDLDGDIVGKIPSGVLKDPEICHSLPYFLHPSLGCPDIGTLEDRQDCFPQKIVLKTEIQNVIYTHSEDYKDKYIMWKGKHYSQVKNNFGSQDGSHENSSFALRIKEEAHFVTCNLETTFPRVLLGVSSEVCPFLAPVLHGLLNCSQGGQCMEYVVLVNLQNHNITKMPIKKLLKSAPQCPSCVLGVQDMYTVFIKIVQAIIKLLSESDLICKLLPDSWLIWFSGCASVPLLSSVSEDACPPVAVMIQVHHTVFFYTSNMGGQDGTNTPQMKWRGKTYGLESVITEKDLLMVLQKHYLVDMNDQVSRKYLPEELNVLPHSRSNHMKPTNPRGGLYSPTTTSTTLPSEPLQEYVGQNDVFLPLNAPKAMPRTKVGECSVTCGQGMRLVQQECVDVMTEELLDDHSCQGFVVPKKMLEPCHLPACHIPRWNEGSWGPCEGCGEGVQYRRVQCVIPLAVEEARGGLGAGGDGNDLGTEPYLVVSDSQCQGERPTFVRMCQRTCTPAPSCDGSDCPSDSFIQIAKDFDY